jgi:hypothetical protein
MALGSRPARRDPSADVYSSSGHVALLRLEDLGQVFDASSIERAEDAVADDAIAIDEVAGGIPNTR